MKRMWVVSGVLMIFFGTNALVNPFGRVKFTNPLVYALYAGMIVFGIGLVIWGYRQEP